MGNKQFWNWVLLQTNNYCEVVLRLLCFAQIYVQLRYLVDTNAIDMCLHVCSLNCSLLVAFYIMLVNPLVLLGNSPLLVGSILIFLTVKSASKNLARSPFQSFQMVHILLFPAKSISPCLLCKPQLLIVKSNQHVCQLNQHFSWSNP